MPLDGFAAKWYQGINATVTTWDELIQLLCNTFGPQKPHPVYLGNSSSTNKTRNRQVMYLYVKRA